MEKGKHFEVWDIECEVLAKGEFLDNNRIIIIEDVMEGEKHGKEYDLLEHLHDDYEGAFCVNIPKQSHDDMSYNIIIGVDFDIGEIQLKDGGDMNESTNQP